MFRAESRYLLRLDPFHLLQYMSLMIFLDVAQFAQKENKKILSALSGTEDFPILACFGVMDYESRHADSNRGPAVYETAALPLSHVGRSLTLSYGRIILQNGSACQGVSRRYCGAYQAYW